MKHYGKYTTEELQYVLANTREWLDNFHRNNRNAMAYPFILNDKVKEIILEYNPYADLAPFDDDGSWIYDGRTNPKERREAFAAFCMENLPIALNFQDADFYLRYAIPEKVKAMDGCFGGFPRYDMNRTRTLTEFTEDDYDSVISRFEGTLEEARLLYDLYLSLVSTPAQTAEATKA